MAPRALVTGATGCVGANVVAALLARGYDVRAMRRTTSALDALDGLDPELVVRCDSGEIEDYAAELFESTAEKVIEQIPAVKTVPIF